MKQKLKNIALTPFLLTLFLLLSCDRVGTNQSVEFWKTEVGWKYFWGIHTHWSGSECNDTIGKYLENRFNSMVSKPNEYQLTYLTLAKHFSYIIDMKRTDAEIKDEISELLKETIRIAKEKKYCSYCGAPLVPKGDDWTCSIGHYVEYDRPWAYGRFSDDVLANMQAHTDLYIDNVCKIIGPQDDLRETVKKSVEVKELRTKTVAGFKRFNVLYEVNHERYVICTITDKGEGKSQINYDFDDRDIDKVLNMWELNNFLDNLAE